MLSLTRQIRRAFMVSLDCGKAGFKETSTPRLSICTSAFCREKHQNIPDKRPTLLQGTQTSHVDQLETDKLYRLMEVEVRGNDPAVLKSYVWYSTTAAHHLGIEVGKCWTSERPHHERYTVLRSIHVNKKCRVQYEFRTYFHFMQFHKLTGSTADTFLEYIQRNLPEGVAMKVTKVGLEAIPEHIKVPEKEELMVEAS